MIRSTGLVSHRSIDRTRRFHKKGCHRPFVRGGEGCGTSARESFRTIQNGIEAGKKNPLKDTPDLAASKELNIFPGRLRIPPCFPVSRVNSSNSPQRILKQTPSRFWSHFFRVLALKQGADLVSWPGIDNMRVSTLSWSGKLQGKKGNLMCSH